MDMTPYVFTRNGDVVARLHANGMVTSNADGAGWLEWDDIGAFLDDAGIQSDPVHWLNQIAAIVQGTPAIEAVPVPAATPVSTPTPAPTPAVKQKRGRKAAVTATAAQPASTPAPAGVLPLPPAPGAAPALHVAPVPPAQLTLHNIDQDVIDKLVAEYGVDVILCGIAEWTTRAATITQFLGMRTLASKFEATGVQILAAANLSRVA